MSSTKNTVTDHDAQINNYFVFSCESNQIQNSQYQSVWKWIKTCKQPKKFSSNYWSHREVSPYKKIGGRPDQFHQTGTAPGVRVDAGLVRTTSTQIKTTIRCAKNVQTERLRRLNPKLPVV